jgi:hypothetical protein
MIGQFGKKVYLAANPNLFIINLTFTEFSDPDFLSRCPSLIALSYKGDSAFVLEI